MINGGDNTARNWNAAETLARILAERERERVAEAVRALRESLDRG
jgi:hypothetical protein